MQTETQTETRLEFIERLVEQLLANESFMSYSSLKQFKDSPKAFIDYKMKTMVQTPAMQFGTMVHCLVLEPDEFDSRYMALDDAEIVAQIGGARPTATKTYKEWKSEQQQTADAAGLEIVEAEAYRKAQAIALNIRHNRSARKVLKMADKREQRIEWKYMNFLFRGIIDGAGDNCIFDLKTCADAEPRKFQRDIVNMGYHIQAALYLKGIGRNVPYYIIAADQKGGVSVHQIEEELLVHGLEEVDKLMSFFNDACLQVKSGKPEIFNESFEFWADRFDGIYKMEKPAYLY